MKGFVSCLVLLSLSVPASTENETTLQGRQVTERRLLQGKAVTATRMSPRICVAVIRSIIHQNRQRQLMSIVKKREHRSRIDAPRPRFEQLKTPGLIWWKPA